MSKKQAELLLAAVIIARSTSYIINKVAIGSFEVFNLMALRFGLGFLLLFAMFHKRFKLLQRRTILRGALLGTIFFTVSALETYGLKTVSPSVDAFLVNSAVLFVPLIRSAIIHRFPDKNAVISGLVALCGIALLTVLSGSFTLGSGAILCCIAAVLYSTAIILTDFFSHDDDSLMLGIIQVGFMGLYAIMFSLLFCETRLPATGFEWGMIFVLAVVCTGFGFTLQPVAQSKTSAERAGLFCALNPLSAMVLDIVCLDGSLTSKDIAGCVLILFSLFLPHILKQKNNTAPMHTVSCK